MYFGFDSVCASIVNCRCSLTTRFGFGSGYLCCRWMYRNDFEFNEKCYGLVSFTVHPHFKDDPKNKKKCRRMTEGNNMRFASA